MFQNNIAIYSDKILKLLSCNKKKLSLGLVKKTPRFRVDFKNLNCVLSY